MCMYTYNMYVYIYIYIYIYNMYTYIYIYVVECYAGMLWCAHIDYGMFIRRRSGVLKGMRETLHPKWERSRGRRKDPK